MSIQFEARTTLVHHEQWEGMIRSDALASFDASCISRIVMEEKAQTVRPSPDDERSQGRGGVMFIDVPGLGNLAVRPCRRGGLIGHFNSRWYFDRGFPRPVQELFFLAELSGQGIQVVEPIAAVVNRRLCGLCYRGFLVTKRCEVIDNLFRGFRRGLIDELQGAELSYLAGNEARRALEAEVLHRDLHPANVLVTPHLKVVLVDFDRAERLMTSVEKLRGRDFLVERWNRAIEKRALPLEWKGQFEAGLRRSE